MFGGEIDAGLIGGILKLDASYNIIGDVRHGPRRSRSASSTSASRAASSMAGMGGFTIRLGLSELGPLSGVHQRRARRPASCSSRNIGLTINDFSAGVEFFKTLPSIDDPFALRGPAFRCRPTITADQWLDRLKQQVALQAKRDRRATRP